MRVPPQNLDAEKSVLGAIMIDPECMGVVSEILRPHHFYAPEHQVMYETMLDLYNTGKAIDAVTVTDLLKKKKKFNASTIEYIAEIVTFVPTSANIKEYTAIVKELSQRRDLISFSGLIINSAEEQEKEIADVINEIESKLFSLTVDSGRKDFFDVKELLEMHVARVEEMSRNPNAIKGIATGMKGLDEVLGGLHRSDLVIIAGRPATGKSSFALDIVRHAIIEEKKSAAFFSLEMPAIQVIGRILSQLSEVSMWEISQGKHSNEAYSRIAESYGLLAEAKFYVDETPGIDINQLRSKARKLKMEFGLDMVVIDYLQLMQGSGRKADNRATEVGEISRALKILARELDVPVVALSQLNRAVESRNDHRPQLSDLRESGSIEQDADIVIFIGRERIHNPDTDKPDSADVIVAKHRNGPTGSVEMRFLDKITSFRDR